MSRAPLVLHEEGHDRGHGACARFSHRRRPAALHRRLRVGPDDALERRYTL